MGGAAQHEALIQHGRISVKTPPPQAVGKDDDALVTGPVFLFVEKAAKRWAHTQQRQQIRRHAGHSEALRRSVIGGQIH